MELGQPQRGLVIVVLYILRTVAKLLGRRLRGLLYSMSDFEIHDEFYLDCAVIRSWTDSLRQSQARSDGPGSGSSFSHPNTVSMCIKRWGAWGFPGLA
jgi:hypothetical protein